MTKKNLLSVLTLLLAFATMTMAQQPYAGCWHPDYIKDWTPETDTEAKFNRSTVPLQPRFYDDGIKANPNQHYTGKVAACLTMNPMCSQTPAQGANNFIGYNPNEWQYMDLVVWWGGSAGEGIIIPPSAPVIDAAHLNGVKMLGNVFFPPTAFGGQPKWVDQMLTKEGGVYPYAKKLYEIAKYYGFDGWFINEETVGGNKGEWTGFIKYFLECAAADGDTNMEVQWYDMGTAISGLEEIIKLSPRTSFFANYGSASAATIQSNMSALAGYGFTPEQSFLKLYSGVENAQGGLYGNRNGFNACFPVAEHKSSIQLFNPEEPIWKKVVEPLLGTPNAEGGQAYAAMNTVFKNSAGFFVNTANDPSNTTARNGSTWPGLANGIQERSAIQQKPFVTSFSAGLGKHRFVNGEKKGTQDWYHRGMQDILPTWRWWVEASNGGNKSDLSFAFNWDDAYNAGTSLVVKGKLNASAGYFTRLYKTKLPVAAGDKFQLVYKTASDGAMQLKVITTDGAAADFNITKNSTSNGWNVADIDLSSLAGKTISVIAVNFKSAETIENYEVRLGQMAVMSGAYAPAAAQPVNVRAQNELKEDISDIRLIWDAPANAGEIHHYNVYFTRGAEKVLAGQTRNEGFYIPKFTRTPGETSVKVSVAAVTKDLKEGGEVEVTMNYPALGLPVVSLKASKTLVKVDEEVTITAIANNFPETYTWTAPANAVLVSQTDNKAVFKFSQQGLYDIKVSVKNATGSTPFEITKFIEVQDAKTLENVAKGKTIHSVSGYIDPEKPEYLIDGVNVPNSIRSKWCVGGSRNHWVVIDLQASYRLYQFKIFDCGHKENSSDNFKNYKIELSNNLEDWTEVLNEKNIPATAAYNTKEAWIKPTVGRYIRFTPYDQEMPITIRIWEFQAFGTAGNMKVDPIGDMQIDMNSTKEITVPYTLGGDPKNENFKVTVQGGKALTFSNITADDSNIKFTISANEILGKENVSLQVLNGEFTVERKFVVEVVDPAIKNLILNVMAAAQIDGGGYYSPEGNELPDPNNENNTTGPVGIKGLTDGKEDTWWVSPYKANAVQVFTYTLDDIYSIRSMNISFKYRAWSFHELYPVKINVYVSETTNDENEFKQVSEILISSIKDKNEIIFDENKIAKFIRFKFTQGYGPGFTLTELAAFGKKTGGTGVDRNVAKETFRIYPNPVPRGVGITLNTEQGDGIQVVSMQGAVLLSEKASGSGVRIDTRNFASGTYIVTVKGKDSILRTGKLVIK